MGSSHMFRGIDTPYVQDQLTGKLGRPAVARTIAWGGPGFDALYFIARDLMANRKVRVLVFYDEINVNRQRNVQATSWFRLGEDAGEIAGLSLEEKGRFYLTAMVGLPRNLLGLVRPNLSADLFPAKPHFQEIILHAPNPATRLGSFPAHVGFNFTPDTYDFTPFVPFTPAKGLSPAEVLVYSPTTRTNFQFSNQPLPAWQLYFARKLAALAREHDTRLVLLHLPSIGEIRSPVIAERACWPDLLEANIAMVGIPPARLFKHLTDDDVRKLYSDSAHFNVNGMEFFTQLITPALLHLYDAETKP